MSNQTYDTIKFIALIIAPVLAFIASLCTIWSVPHCAEITATLTALDTLVGAIVAIVSYQYNKPLPVDIEGLQYLEDSEEEGGEDE